jgi:hypothetical protein
MGLIGCLVGKLFMQKKASRGTLKNSKTLI